MRLGVGSNRREGEGGEAGGAAHARPELVGRCVLWCCQVRPHGRVGVYTGVDALVWLHEHGAPWDYDTCWWAPSNGNLEALQYAVSRGCEWDRVGCLHRARRYGHEHVADWIEQQFPARG